MSPTRPKPALPRPEVALRSLLAAQPEAVAQELGPLAWALLARLRLQGPAPRRGPGAPDGLAGIDRRGPFDRLMHSEWALLDVVPEAFLQRAADAELMFLALHTEAPRPPTALRALLDGGPSQLGLPRQGQAAALLALAAWAASEGLPLRWGGLSADGLGLMEGLGEGWLDRLRAARRAQPAEGSDWQRATAALEPEERLVTLGPPGRPLGAPPGGLHLSVLAEGDVLHIGLDDRPGMVWAAGFGGTATLRPVSPPRSASPKAIAARTWGMALRPGFFFSPSGARLLGETAYGRAVALPVEADAEASRRPHLREVHGQVLGLGWVGQRLATLSLDAQGELWAGVGQRWAEVRAARPVPPLTLVLPEAAAAGQGPRPGLLTGLDGAAGVALLPQPGAPLRCAAEGPMVRAGLPAHLRLPDGAQKALLINEAGELAPLIPRSGGLPVAVGEGRGAYSLRQRERQAELLGPELGSMTVAGGGQGLERAVRLWVSCAGRRPRHHLLRSPRGGSLHWQLSGGLAVPADAELFGVLVPQNEAPCLLVSTGGALELRGYGAPRTLPVSAHPVAWAAASPRGDAVAWLDAAGVLVVWHLPSASAIATARPQ